MILIIKDHTGATASSGLRAEIRHRTERAVLVDLSNGRREWLPLSECSIKDNKIYLNQWIARTKLI